jgi:DNA-binding SARP family transcriptional activator
MTERQPSRFVAALNTLIRMVWLIALLTVIPVVLVKAVGWPLPTVMPSLGTVLDSIQAGDYDPAILVKVVAVVVWVAWAMLLVSVVVQAWAQIRQVDVVCPRFVSKRLFSATGRWVSGVTVAASSIVMQTGVASAAPLATMITQQQPLTVGNHVTTGVARFAVDTVAVQRYQTPAEMTLFEVAEHFWGSQASVRYPELLAANKGAIDPDDLIPAGTTLTIPTDAADSSEDDDWRSADDPSESVQRPVLGTVTVEKGDHFWKLSEEVLSQAYGRTATDAEVAPYWRDMVELNESSVASGDPNLIFAGEQYQVLLPDLPDDVADRTITLPHLVTRVDSPVEIPAPQSSEPVEVEAPAAPVEMEAPISVAQVTEAPAAPVVVPVAVAADTQGSDSGVPVMVFAAVGLSAVGAGALLLGLRRRRAVAARIRGVGEQLEPPTEDMMSLLSRLRGVAASDVTVTVDAMQRLLRRSLATHGGPVPSVLVTRAGLNGVELLLDEPVSDAPREFVSVDDGHCWVLSPDVTDAQLAAVRSDSTGFMPSLVSIGSNEVGSVLVDIERLGALEIRCDEPHTTGVGVLAAMAAEWEGAPWLDREEAQILAIGLPSTMFNAFERVRQVRDGELADEVQRLVDAARADAMTYPAGKHAERVATDAFIFGPTIVLVGPDHGEEAMTLAEAALVSGSGLAVVALTGLPRGSSQLVVTGSGAVLEPFGLDLDRFVMLEPAMAFAVAEVVESSDEIHPAAPWPEQWHMSDEATEVEWVEGPDKGFVSGSLHDEFAESDGDFDRVDSDRADVYVEDDWDDDTTVDEVADVTTGSLRELTMAEFVDLSRFDPVVSSHDDDGPDDDGPKGSRINTDSADIKVDESGDGHRVMDGVDEAELVLAELSVPTGTVGLSLLGGDMPTLIGVESPSGHTAPRAIELFTFLSLMGPRSQAQILAALWPDSTNQTTVVQALSRMRKAISPATITSVDGRYALQGVDCDWTRFLRLVDHANRLDGRGAMVLLRAALEMVQSRPFAGRQVFDGRASTWDWLDLGYVESDVLVRIVDASEAFAELALRAGDGSAALWSCEIARLCEPRREATHTIRMQAYALMGDRDGLHREVRQAVASAAIDDPLAERPQNVMQLLRVLEEQLSAQRREQASS